MVGSTPHLKRGGHRFTKFGEKSHKSFVNTALLGDGEGDVEDEDSTVGTAGSIGNQRPTGVLAACTQRFWTRIWEPVSSSNRSPKRSIMTPPSCSASTNRRGRTPVSVPDQAWHSARRFW